MQRGNKGVAFFILSIITFFSCFFATAPACGAEIDFSEYVKGQISPEEYAQFLHNGGIPTISSFFYRTSDTMFLLTDEEVIKRKAAFAALEPLLSEEDWEVLMFDNQYYYSTQHFFSNTRELIDFNASMTKWAGLLEKTEDPDNLNKLINILSYYQERNTICELNDAMIQSLKNKLAKQQARDINPVWIQKAIWILYNSSVYDFDTFLEQGEKYNVKAGFLYEYLTLRNVAYDENEIDFIIDLYNDDESLQSVIIGYFDSVVQNANTDQYKEGFMEQCVAGQDRNKVAIVVVDDGLNGEEQTYMLSPLSLLVPQNMRLSVQDLTNAGTVVYLHYIYVNPIPYKIQGTDKTIYGYRTDCIITKMDITTSNVLSEITLWGEDLPYTVSFFYPYGERFSGKPPKIDRERILEIIGG